MYINSSHQKLLQSTQIKYSHTQIVRYALWPYGVTYVRDTNNGYTNMYANGGTLLGILSMSTTHFNHSYRLRSFELSHIKTLAHNHIEPSQVILYVTH